MVYGGDGNDIITSIFGKNFIDAGDGNDQINVGGNDRVLAGNGDDAVNLEHGTAQVTLGAGADTISAFAESSSSYDSTKFSGFGTHSITDFTSGDDKINPIDFFEPASDGPIDHFVGFAQIDSNHDNVVDAKDFGVSQSTHGLSLDFQAIATRSFADVTVTAPSSLSLNAIDQLLASDFLPPVA